MSKPFECVQLPCPKCGKADAILLLRLQDGTYTCEECGTGFDRADVEDFISRWTVFADVEDLISRWTVFLAWLDTCPVQK